MQPVKSIQQLAGRAWENIFKKPKGPYWDFGDYTFNGSLYLVIGLGEDFKGRHYKLIVSVITKSKIYMSFNEGFN